MEKKMSNELAALDKLAKAYKRLIDWADSLPLSGAVKYPITLKDGSQTVLLAEPGGIWLGDWKIEGLKLSLRIEVAEHIPGLVKAIQDSLDAQTAAVEAATEKIVSSLPEGVL